MTTVCAPSETWISDKNKNRCSVGYWGAPDKAQAALDSLVDCYDCVNCCDCSDLKRCTECKNCTKCFFCRNCSHCLHCAHCSNCSKCSYCDSAKFDDFLKAVASGQTPGEVSLLPGMPSLKSWSSKRKKDAAYAARFAAMWEALPFPVQARGQRLGARFAKECERLFREGMPDWKIAEMLGVTTMSVNHRTQKLRGNLK